MASCPAPWWALAVGPGFRACARSPGVPLTELYLLAQVHWPAISLQQTIVTLSIDTPQGTRLASHGRAQMPGWKHVAQRRILTLRHRSRCVRCAAAEQRSWTRPLWRRRMRPPGSRRSCFVDGFFARRTAACGCRTAASTLAPNPPGSGAKRAILVALCSLACHAFRPRCCVLIWLLVGGSVSECSCGLGAL